MRTTLNIFGRILLLTYIACAVIMLAPVTIPLNASAQGDAALPEIIAIASAQTNCASGAGGFVPLECFQGSRRLTDAYTTGDLGTYMNKVFVAAISLGAIIAVLRLAWAGFVYMGTDMWGKKEHAKEVIQDTLLGLFLLIAIWLILNQINPQILQLKITAPPLPASTPASAPGASPSQTPPPQCPDGSTPQYVTLPNGSQSLQCANGDLFSVNHSVSIRLNT